MGPNITNMSIAVDDAPDVDVAREDQQRINLFGRLNNKKHSLEERIKELKEKLNNYEDAQTEMMLLDDDCDVKFLMGDTFSMYEPDQANEMLEAEMEDLQKEMEGEEEALTKIQEQMSDLKTKLYAKFGKSINLEENPTS